MLLKNQQQDVRKALDLFLRTQVAFANCEANGLKIDVSYLKQAMEDTRTRIVELEHKIKNTYVWRRWCGIFGASASLTARQQLGKVLFKNTKSPHPKNLGFECRVCTPSGLPEISEATLERIPELGAFSEDYVLWMSLNKLLATNLNGIEKGLDPNGFLHPSFSLFSVLTYRTSSSAPNFQNFPNRNKELAGVVRRCFIPRALDRHIVEVDYSGAEVRVNASINKDPTLMSSIIDGVDFHKVVASLAYMLPEEAVTKQLRQSVKGEFTFAAFYGSWWKAIAEGLWDGIMYGGLKLKDETPLLDHLKSCGIVGLGEYPNPAVGTYYNHIRHVEEKFWGELFKIYAEWKEKAWQDYLRDKYVNTPSGFRCGGVFTKNMVTNIPAQAGAAHCLLWSFVRLDQMLQEKGFRACLCGQIHDSIVLDVPHEELDDVLGMTNDIMTRQLPQFYKWLAVPMEVEADVAPMGKSWWDKEAYPIPVQNG